jgi:hypothetical protein
MPANGRWDLIRRLKGETSPTRGVRRSAGRVSGGALDRRLSVKKEKKHPTLNTIFMSLSSLDIFNFKGRKLQAPRLFWYTSFHSE